MATCAKHSDCSTGFCDKAFCYSPTLNRPCNEGKCPAGQICHPLLQRCKHSAAQNDNVHCTTYTDCDPRKLCANGKCVTRPGTNYRCSSTQLCISGHSCIDGKCIERCELDSQCFAPAACQKTSASGPYKLCVGGFSQRIDTGRHDSHRTNIIPLVGMLTLMVIVIAVLIFVYKMQKVQARKEEATMEMVDTVPPSYYDATASESNQKPK